MIEMVMRVQDEPDGLVADVCYRLVDDLAATGKLIIDNECAVLAGGYGDVAALGTDEHVEVVPDPDSVHLALGLGSNGNDNKCQNLESRMHHGFSRSIRLSDPDDKYPVFGVTRFRFWQVTVQQGRRRA